MSTVTTPAIAPFAGSIKAMEFVLAGNAYFTVRSEKTGTRFTYRVKRAGLNHPARDMQPPVWFVSVLTGPDNTTDYSYLGLIRPPKELPDGPLAFEHGAKSHVAPTAPSVIAAFWVFGQLLRNRPTPQCSIFHEGRCGRCGRALTVPESIVSGFGPECIQHV